MRKNGGFFTDYISIDEDEIAADCSLTREVVYDKLCNMTRLRIINYVPHKNLPQVTYTQRRIDTQYVELRPEVYEQRMQLYKERIEAMVGYFTETSECRSRYLLHYFDDDAPDCGYCDVCIAKEMDAAVGNGLSENDLQTAITHIMQVLSDDEPHDISTLKTSDMKSAIFDMALQQLMADEKINYVGTKIKRTV